MTRLLDPRHDEPIQTDQAANVVLSAVPSSSAISDHAKPGKGSGCLSLVPQPRSYSNTSILNRRSGVNSQPALDSADSCTGSK